MTTQNTNLDVNWKVVDENGKPTQYFEDLWFNMVSTMGGEGGNLVSDIQDGQKIAAFAPIISKLEKDINDLQAQQQGRIDLTNIQQSIDELNAQIISRVDLTPLLNAIDTINSQIQNRVDLSCIIKRLDDLEATN